MRVFYSNQSVDFVQVLFASINGTLYPNLPAEPATTTSEVKPSTPVAIGDPVGAVGSFDRKLDKKMEKTEKKIEKLEKKIEKLEQKKSSLRPEPEVASHPDPRVQVFKDISCIVLVFKPETFACSGHRSHKT